MPALLYFPCPLFPGEVEDYYCTNCHTSCSALSLLVGPHTGHSRVPLSLAALYFPSALRRNAHTLLQRLRDEYSRPREEHMLDLSRSFEHLRCEREQKVKEIEELQCQVRIIDRKLNVVEQKRVAAMCHWLRRRQHFADEVRKILNGADTLAKALGLKGAPSSASRGGAVEEQESLSTEAREASARELDEVQKILSKQRELLADEEGNVGPGLSVDSECCCSLEESGSECGTVHFFHTEDMLNSQKGTSGPSASLAGDTRPVLDDFLAFRVPSGTVSSDAHALFGMTPASDDVSACTTVGEEVLTGERGRWWDDVRRREQLLREGLDRHLRNPN